MNTQERQDLLSTRGLFAIKIRVPARPPGDSFTWLLQPPEDVGPGATWFIDGSLFDESKRFARRTGFGVAVSDSQGSLIGFGRGVP